MADDPDDIAAQEHHLRHNRALGGGDFDLDEFLRQCRGIYMLLDQDQIWINKAGQRHELASMSVRYKTNVLRFMRKRAKWLGAMYQWGWISSMGQPSYREVIGVEAEGTPQQRTVYGRSFSDLDLMSECVSDDFDRWADELDEAIKRDPEAWLDSTPLMKALSDQVLAGVGGTDGDGNGE